MAFNKNELLLDRVRSVVADDLTTGEMVFRLTSVEDPSLQCSAEGEQVTDAVGAIITTMYRAKQATFSGSNSLVSLDLAAAQFGAKKEIASATSKISVPTYEIITIANGSITLKHKATNNIKYIYSIDQNEIGTRYVAGAAASETEFLVNNEGDTTVITVPTDLTGKIYVEYDYESENAVSIRNAASNFPSAVRLRIFAYFKDRCNENLVYSGVIISPKAKLNPEQIELALTTTGKHPFEFVMMKDYCAEEGMDELFSIVVTQD